jgi:hypothetical protein
MRGFENKFFYHSYVPVRFFAAVRAIDFFFFCLFHMFYIKMKLLQGDRTPQKIFIKNQLILV